MKKRPSKAGLSGIFQRAARTSSIGPEEGAQQISRVSTPTADPAPTDSNAPMDDEPTTPPPNTGSVRPRGTPETPANAPARQRERSSTLQHEFPSGHFYGQRTHSPELPPRPIEAGTSTNVLAPALPIGPSIGDSIAERDPDTEASPIREVAEPTPLRWLQAFSEQTNGYETELNARRRYNVAPTSVTLAHALYAAGAGFARAVEDTLDSSTSDLITRTSEDPEGASNYIRTHPDLAAYAVYDTMHVLCNQYSALRRTITAFEEAAAQGNPAGAVMTAFADVFLLEQHPSPATRGLPPPPAYLDEIRAIAESIRQSVRAQTPMAVDTSAAPSCAQSVARAMTPTPAPAPGPSAGTKRSSSTGAPTRPQSRSGKRNRGRSAKGKEREQTPPTTPVATPAATPAPAHPVPATSYVATAKAANPTNETVTLPPPPKVEKPKGPSIAKRYERPQVTLFGENLSRVHYRTVDPVTATAYLPVPPPLTGAQRHGMPLA